MSQDLSFDEAETACDTRVDGDSEFDKDEMKVIKRFCGRLLEEAHEDWEDHEKAKLVLLIQSNLAMSERKFWKWLIKHADPSAELVACLGDNGLTVQATSLVQMFGRGSFPHVISRMESSFEAGILDITSDDVLQSVNPYRVPSCRALLTAQVCSDL